MGGVVSPSNPPPSSLHAAWLDTTQRSALPSCVKCVVANVSVGHDPAALALDPQIGAVLVADFGGSNLTVVNLTTDRAVGSWNVGNEPSGVVVDPSLGMVLVSNEFSDNVSVLSSRTGAAEASIGVGLQPEGIALDPVNGDVYVNNFGSDNVSVIDPATAQVVASVPVGNNPGGGIAVDPSSGDVLVANEESSNLSVLSPSASQAVGSVPVGEGPSAIAIDPATDEAFVANTGPFPYQSPSNVTVVSLSLERATGTLGVGADPSSIVIGGPQGQVFVGNAGSNNVSAINATFGLTAPPVNPGPGSDPTGVALSPNGSELLVSEGALDRLAVVALLSPAPVLVSGLIEPSSEVLENGTSVDLEAEAVCSPTPCPATISFSWSQQPDLGSFNATHGPDVEFTAGPTAGNDTLFVNLTEGSTVRQAHAVVSIYREAVPKPSSPPKPIDWAEWVAVAVVVAVVAELLLILVLRKQRARRDHDREPREEGAEKEEVGPEASTEDALGTTEVTSKTASRAGQAPPEEEPPGGQPQGTEEREGPERSSEG